MLSRSERAAEKRVKLREELDRVLLPEVRDRFSVRVSGGRGDLTRVSIRAKISERTDGGTGGP